MSLLDKNSYSFSPKGSFDIDGYKVKFKTTSTSIDATITKKDDKGTTFTYEAGIKGVSIDYDYDVHFLGKDDAYFRMDWTTYNKVRLEHKKAKTLYGDLSNVEPQNFLNSFKSIWSPTVDDAEMVIPIAEVRVPVPSAPVVNARMTLDLTFQVDGKIELSLSNAHSVGYDNRGGQHMLINESSPSFESVIQANASAVAGLSAGLDIGTSKVADVRLEAGVGITAEASVHSYDRKNNHKVEKTSLPPDVTTEMAEGNGNVFVCTDISAYWIGNVILNSKDTWLGRLGMSYTKNLGGKDHPIAGKSHLHYENWEAVPKCTRGDRDQVGESLEQVETDSISIDRYALMGIPGQTRRIQVTSLPEGISSNGIEFVSSDPSVASVGPDGTIQMKKEGTAVITVRTKEKDAKGRQYSVQCTVSVHRGDKT